MQILPLTRSRHMVTFQERRCARKERQYTETAWKEAARWWLRFLMIQSCASTRMNGLGPLVVHLWRLLELWAGCGLHQGLAPFLAPQGK